MKRTVRDLSQDIQLVHPHPATLNNSMIIVQVNNKLSFEGETGVVGRIKKNKTGNAAVLDAKGTIYSGSPAQCLTALVVSINQEQAKIQHIAHSFIPMTETSSIFEGEVMLEGEIIEQSSDLDNDVNGVY
jgi:hypothetical protein